MTMQYAKFSRFGWAQHGTPRKLQLFSFWCGIQCCESRASDTAGIGPRTQWFTLSSVTCGTRQLSTIPVSPTPSDSDTVYTFTVSLTVYSLIKKKTPKGKAATSKEEKSVKVKELQFSIDNTNYLDFLQSILNKHGQDQYMLLVKKQFSFKYIPLKVKR